MERQLSAKTGNKWWGWAADTLVKNFAFCTRAKCAVHSRGYYNVITILLPCYYRVASMYCMWNQSLFMSPLRSQQTSLWSHLIPRTVTLFHTLAHSSANKVVCSDSTCAALLTPKSKLTRPGWTPGSSTSCQTSAWWRSHWHSWRGHTVSQLWTAGTAWGAGREHEQNIGYFPVLLRQELTCEPQWRSPPQFPWSSWTRWGTSCTSSESGHHHRPGSNGQEVVIYLCCV